MNKERKSIRRAFWIFCALFIVLGIYIVGLLTIERSGIIHSTYNPRLSMTDESVKRGSIYDRNGVVLAESIASGQGYQRKYPYKSALSHITGYTGLGKTGLEAYAGFDLTNLHNSILQRISATFADAELVGDSLWLTVSAELTEFAYSELEGEKGAIVLLDPTTGEVLALASSPGFDPETAAANWEYLRADERSPLLNRAVMGLYTPGSTFKVVMSLAAMRHGMEAFVYNCEGEAVFEDKVIHCSQNTAHGEIGLKEAMAFSCNCYFAELARGLGGNAIANTAKDLLLDSELKFVLGSAKGNLDINSSSSEALLVETGIGQGKTLVTPLYMASLAGAIANEGIMMEPFIISHKEYYNGKEGAYELPKKTGRIMTSEEAAKLSELMNEVV
ncbi:MAG: penicillin-binding protein 2, partial [Firmicutes bacterium]|nr:penicillin-binding protein 2 [Bacillota bacterium]